jgi:hypothetical protein
MRFGEETPDPLEVALDRLTPGAITQKASLRNELKSGWACIMTIDAL